MKENAPHCGSGGCGNCGGCGGCSASLQVTPVEVELLRQFAEIPFLPVGRQSSSEMPVYLEAGQENAAAYGAAITGLFQKRLIDLDYDVPLSNFDYKQYEHCSHKGSMALTARGQMVVEQLEIQGMEQ